MRRFSDLSDGEFMSETTDGKYCLYAEAEAEIKQLRKLIPVAKGIPSPDRKLLREEKMAELKEARWNRRYRYNMKILD